MIDFTQIDYLKSGNLRQQIAYKELIDLKVFEDLKEFTPILTGTIPIGIDIPESDLDIICACENLDYFSTKLTKLYAQKVGFRIYSSLVNHVRSVICNFILDSFEVEIFGQNIPTIEQNAYKHMVIEHKILTQKGAEFQSKIKKLKLQGIKTEPAFAKLLGLEGNPYEALLKLTI